MTNKPYQYGRVAPAPDGRYAPAPKPSSPFGLPGQPTSEAAAHGEPVVKKARPKGATCYFEMAQDSHAAGNTSIVTDNNSHAYLVGSGGTPPLPASGIWDLDRLNVEPPLGEDISAVDQMLTVSHGGAALAQPVPDEVVAPIENSEDAAPTEQPTFMERKF